MHVYYDMYTHQRGGDSRSLSIVSKKCWWFGVGGLGIPVLSIYLVDIWSIYIVFPKGTIITYKKSLHKGGCINVKLNIIHPLNLEVHSMLSLATSVMYVWSEGIFILLPLLNHLLRARGILGKVRHPHPILLKVSFLPFPQCRTHTNKPQSTPVFIPLCSLDKQIFSYPKQAIPMNENSPIVSEKNKREVSIFTNP